MVRSSAKRSEVAISAAATSETLALPATVINAGGLRQLNADFPTGTQCMSMGRRVIVWVHNQTDVIDTDARHGQILFQQVGFLTHHIKSNAARDARR